MTGALDGVTVIDFSRVLAGPYATMLLGDLGADVLKIERPGTGDETRAWTPPTDATGTATYFASVNRNKRGLALDLGTPAGADAARRLVADADVLVENFRTGTMARLGLDWDELHELNPRLIYCSITGFGAGEGAALPGFDLLVQAVGGLMSITGPVGTPSKTGVAVVDVMTGLHATAGILAALHARAATGEGQRVEVNLLSSLLSGLVNQSGAFVGAGVVPASLGNAHPSIAPYEVFPTADRPLAVAVGTDGQFAAFASAIGLPDLAANDRFATNPARVANRDALAAVVSARLSTASADHWFAVLTAHDVPAGPINGIDEAFALADRLGLGPVVDAAGSRQVANPIRLSATPVTYRLAPPALDDGAPRAS